MRQPPPHLTKIILVLYSMKKLLFLTSFFFSFYSVAQHDNELYNDGALIHIQPGAEVHVWGDVHNYQETGDLQNNGLLKVQGNMYSDDLFRQQGTGTTRIENSDVNVGERQFISGSYAVRSTGSSAKGTAADGSFYNLELVNDQGIVYLVNTVGGTYDKYVADVRNSVHYNLGVQMNRIVTADIGMTGAPVYPAIGSSYPAIFGMMNPTSPLGGSEGWIQNTVQMNGNMSNVDWGYVQGKMRQQIDATTGYQYPFVVGVEPGGPGMQKGMQYARIDFSTGADYDVLEAYFERALPNTFAPADLECSGYVIGYFGGSDHGQWVFDNPAGGSSQYEMNLWPQDDNFPAQSVWMITKDNGIAGFSNSCGPTPVGLSRGGFSGFSTFSVAGGTVLLGSCGNPTVLSTNGSFPSGSQLTITGIEFGNQQLTGSVLINGTVMPVVSWSNTEIIVTIPPSCSGDIIVTNACGNAAPPFAYIVDNTPNIVAVSSDGQPNGSFIDIAGFNFGNTGTVTLNGVIVTVTNWTPTVLSINIPETCSGDLIVTNDCGEVSLGFYYNVGWTDPIVSATSGSVSSGSIVQITGTGFSTSGSLTLNGLNMDVVSWDYFNISAIVPIGACSGDLVITNNCGNVSPSFPYIVDNTPNIVAVSNDDQPNGSLIDIFGINFGISGTVTLNGVSVSITNWTNTALTIIIPETCSGDLIVTNDCGEVSAGFYYNVGWTNPIVSATSGSVPSGSIVQIIGTGFSNSGSLTFNGLNMDVVYWDYFNISAIVPIGVCSGDLVITNNCGNVSPSFSYTADNSNTGTDVQTSCDSYTWIDGTTYTLSNNSATVVLSNTSGCDSTVTLDLTITNSNTGTDVQTSCDSYTWIDGNTYTSSNNSVTFVLSNATGCDSTVTLDLTITNSNTGTDVQTACDSYSWIDGTTYTSSNNSATFVLSNTSGCDSTVTLDLTITNSNTGTDVQTACDSYTWIDGNTYTSSNNSATFVLTNTSGCDSTVTLDLTITNSNSGTDVITSCDSYTWIDGNTYTSGNNSATVILSNATGCDSTVTLDLTITNSNTGTDVQTACDSYSWIDGTTYTSSNNSATFVLTNTSGCDSTVTLDLSINPSYTVSSDSTILENELPFTWNGLVFTSSGSQTAILSTINNCDSIVIMNLTVDPLVGILNGLNDEGYSVNLYPNPTNDELFLSIRNNGKLKCRVTLFNKLGQIVMSENYTIYNGLNEEKMNLKKVLDGSYFLKFDFGENQIIWKKVIKI